MYIFKSNAPEGEDQYLSKSSKNTVASASATDTILARLPIAPVVPAQTALLSGSLSPSSEVLESISQSIINAGVISTIGAALAQDYVKVAANEQGGNAVIASLEAYSKNILDNLSDASLAAVPIASLSEAVGSATPLMNAPTELMNNGLAELIAPSAPASAAMVVSADTLVIDVSTLPTVSAPVVIAALSDNAITVLDSVNGNVQITDFVAPQASVENFINTGAGTLTVTTAASHVSSLSLSGKVAFTALADEVTSGITVSGQSDSSNVTLFLVGGASSAHGSSDFITLGNGNNFVFDAGDGQVLVNLGSGQNTVLLAGVGVTGVVNIANHDSSVGDFVALAANGIASAHDLASSALVTIAGLNNTAQSQDAISFLGDMDSQLMWSAGTAGGSQVTHVQGNVASLENWISAAQNQASSAHSVAWFQFGGNTYILESAQGKAGDHAGDTLVKLTGLTQFTNTDGDLSVGMIHLAG